MNRQERLEKVNQAAGQRASLALSKIMRQPTEVVFFSPQVVAPQEINSLIDLKQYGVGVFLPIKGIKGSGIFLFPQEIAFNLCDAAMKREQGTTREFSQFDQDILKEISNILLGNYLAVFSNEFDQEVIEGMPKFSAGLFGAILEELIANLTQVASSTLVIKIEFTIKLQVLTGDLILIFETQDIQALLGA